MLSSLPDILIGVVIVLVLSASMSTPILFGIDLQFHANTGLLKDNVLKNLNEKTAPFTNACTYCIFHSAFGCSGIGSAYFYRSVNGDFLGRFSRRFSGAISLWIVLEGGHQSCSLGKFAAGIGITVTNMFWNYISSPLTLVLLP